MTSPGEALPLIPMPRRVRRTGGTVPVPTFATADGLSACLTGVQQITREPWSQFVEARITGAWCGMPPIEQQGYRLAISPLKDGRADARPPVQIEAPTALGLRHAIATLVQLVRAFPRALPCLEVDDRPGFAARGVMLDVSRDRIPTMAEFRRLIPELASLKINNLQLYTEHTFAYAGHEEVWHGWSPITPGEARELDSLCASHAIDLAANQNCFGHLRQWLRHPKYAHLAETHGEWMFDVWKRSGPFSLCPTDPASVVFVRGLLDQLLPNFSSRLVNIGCDETYDIAFGRSKDDVVRRGRSAVAMDFVRAIEGIVRSHGKRAMFWADIALSDPLCVPRIPAEMIALAWGYEPDSPFDRWCETLARAGRECWVCPGTSSWRSLAGRSMERKANISAAARAGVAHGASGFLVCDWGDTGHWQQWPISMLGIANGAASAWNPDAEFDCAAASLQALDGHETLVGPWLDELGDVDLRLRETCLGLSRPGMRGRLRNQGAMFIDLFKKPDEDLDVGSGEDWDATLQRAERCAAQRPVTGRRQLDDELAHTVELVRFAAAKAAWRRHPEGLSDARLRDLLERLDALSSEHARFWRARSREGGLSDSLGYFEQVRAMMASHPTARGGSIA